jgi:DNA-binding MarR family transcriptional regulator
VHDEPVASPPPGRPPEAAWLEERPEHGLSDPLQELLILARTVRFAMAARLGISETELHAMEHVLAEPMGPVELSRRLDLTSAAATVLMHRLEASGHVQRTPHPSDGRRQVLVPRPEGLGAVFGALRPLLERLDAVAVSFDEHERAVVARYLEAVNEALRETVAEWRAETAGAEDTAAPVARRRGRPSRGSGPA